ncbi:hypothetical protein ACS0TY_035019 [Phlomoides rotata]
MAGTSEPHASAFSTAELEFLAEDEMIEIVLNLRMDTLNFIYGDFGHFRPQIPTQVPMWLAVALKRRGKCTIRSPEWMSVGKIPIEDIKDVRFHKIGTGLEIISMERTYELRLKNLSAMEGNIVRPFVTRALETFYKLGSSDMIKESDQAPNRQPQTTNRGPRRQLKDR